MIKKTIDQKLFYRKKSCFSLCLSECPHAVRGALARSVYVSDVNDVNSQSQASMYVVSF